MAVLIVCKAITVWTQVIFTMLVSNRVSCTRPEWLRFIHRTNSTHTRTHKVAQLKHTTTRSRRIKAHFRHTQYMLESSTPHLSEALKGSGEPHGVKVTNLSTCMERLKAELELTPPVPRHECSRRHRSRRDSPRAMSPPQPLTSHDSRTLQNSLLASASRVNPMGENKKKWSVQTRRQQIKLNENRWQAAQIVTSLSEMLEDRERARRGVYRQFFKACKCDSESDVTGNLLWRGEGKSTFTTRVLETH